MKKKLLICNSTKEKEIWHDKVWGGSNKDKFLHCINCDIVFLYPFPNIKDVSNFIK